MPLHHLHAEPDLAFGVWKISEAYQDLRKSLCEQDARSLEHISSESRASESAAARLLLSELCRHGSVDYEGLDKDADGAPQPLKSGSHVSLSHTRGYAAGIIHNAHPVGIDIELLDDRIHLMAHRVLSEKEMRMVGDDADKAVVFWAMKETLYKIHRTRKLTFASDLLIDDFELHQEGVTTGEIRTGGNSKRCTLYYELMDGMAVTYGF